MHKYMQAMATRKKEKGLRVKINKASVSDSIPGLPCDSHPHTEDYFEKVVLQHIKTKSLHIYTLTSMHSEPTA